MMPLPTSTKVIATIGPASESPEMVRRLINTGVSIFRFNFSHGTFEEHERRLKTLRAAAKELSRPTAALGDLQGPKIRVASVQPEGLMLEPGQDMVFRRDVENAFVEDGTPVFGSTYERLIDEVEPGQRVLINDGNIRMLAVDRARNGDELRCRVTVGGLVTSGKGINLPESEVSAPAITERDWEWVNWAVEHDIDVLALSFVRRAEEILELKRALAGMCALDRSKAEVQGSGIPVIAKIEKPQAIDNLDEIVAAADAVMVARGDLGVEMDIAKVPVVARRVLKACRDWGKPSIIATQMLESMIDSATPTRAEATDVATAVFAEADVVMLSGETAIGKHPDLVVEQMVHILHEAEDARNQLVPVASPPARLVESRYKTAALAHGAWHVAHDLNAKLVVCWSQTGGTARYLSQNNFQIPIIAYSSAVRQTRRMAFLSGVIPIRRDPPESGALRDWTDQVEELLVDRGWAREGDIVVLLAGKPLGKSKATDSVAVLTLGDRTSGYRGFARHEEDGPR